MKRLPKHLSYACRPGDLAAAAADRPRQQVAAGQPCTRSTTPGTTGTPRPPRLRHLAVGTMSARGACGGSWKRRTTSRKPPPYRPAFAGPMPFAS